MKLLVSGVAGDIGLGVGRILKDWGIFDQLFGIDISDDHPGSIIFDHIKIAPRANNINYLEWVCDFINKHNIDIFIPTSEDEISVITNNIEEFRKYVKVLINDKIFINKCFDKYETLNFLKSNGIRVPANGIVGKDNPMHYPVVVKPRRGHGSKDLQIIDSKVKFENCNSEMVWQDFLSPDDQEFTCAVYVTKNMEIRSLQIKRILISGFTGKGMIVKNNDITNYLESIAKTFKIPGCYNIQLRLTKNGPILFEINPRLSSTLVFRDKLGFNDLRWWLIELMNLKLPSYKEIPEGIKIYRGNIEYIIEASS